MELKPWVKTALVAAAGGAISALMAALMDPAGFNVKYKLGEGKLAAMVLEGAAVAVAALFVRSPQAQQLMGGVKQAQQQAAQDKAALEKFKSDIKPPPTGPPAGGKTP